jgi:uncharacterized protein YciI
MPGHFLIRRRPRNVGAGSYVAGMATFALTTVHGPNWDEARPIREQKAWDEHAAFMDGLVDDGFIIIGGPLSDGARTLHCVEADGEPQVAARFAEDPWAAMGLLEVSSIEPWALWLDGRPGR